MFFFYHLTSEEDLLNLTEEENEDSDPGGTSVLRVTRIEYLFGLGWFFEKLKRLNTLGLDKKRVAYSKIRDQLHPLWLGNVGGVL
jgi:hypothetical protein